MKTNSLTIILLSNLLISLISTEEQIPSSDNLYFVYEHFRHGARAPTHINDKNIDLFGTEWPEGPGELTKNGIAQVYWIGIRNRLRYAGFLDFDLDPKEIWVYSTNVNRTMMSAHSQWAGQYSNKNYSIDENIHPHAKPPINITFPIKDVLNFVPVPVHIYEDKLLNTGNTILEKPFDFDRDVNCPKVIPYRNRNMNDKKITDFIFQFQQNYSEFLKTEYNINDSKTYKNIHYICDAFFANYFFENTSLDKFKSKEIYETFYESCKTFHNLKQFFVDQGGEAAFTGVMTISEPMRNILHWMELRMDINNNTITKYNSPKMVIYSAHDTTVASFQNYMNQAFGTEFKTIPYATTQFYELRKYGDQFYVEYYYNDVLMVNVTYAEFKEKVLSIAWSYNSVVEFCVGYSKIDIYIFVWSCVLIALVLICVSWLCFLCKGKKSDFIKVIETKEDASTMNNNQGNA